MWAREWQYKDVLNDIDDLMWEDLSEEWQKKPVRGRRKYCLVKSALGPQEVPVQISRTGAQPRSVPASPRFQKKKKTESSLELSNLFRRVLDVWKIHLNAECLLLKTSGKPKRFRPKGWRNTVAKEWKKAFCELRGAAQMSVKA